MNKTIQEYYNESYESRKAVIVDRVSTSDKDILDNQPRRRTLREYYHEIYENMKGSDVERRIAQCLEFERMTTTTRRRRVCTLSTIRLLPKALKKGIPVY